MQKIIGITGLYGAGKDESARIIKDSFPLFDFKIIAFADGVRKVYETITGETIPDDYSQEWKESVNPIFRKTRRSMLEGIGNGMRKFVHEDVWVNCVLAELKKGGNYIVTGVRYENELRMIEQFGGKMIRVVRKNNPHQSVLSPINTDLKDFYMPEIQNNGDVADLVIACIDIMYELFPEECRDVIQ